MSRLEFPGKVREKAALRAGGRCEKCGGVYTKPEFDHILPDALGGKPELANCMVLCRQCHKEKTAQDVKRIRKADRQRRASLGANAPSARPLQSRGFSPSPKERRELRKKANGLTRLQRMMADDRH